MVPAGVYGIDFLGAYPDPQLLTDRGVEFVALYLKNWRADWVDAARALGVGIVPIMEVKADEAALGAPQGIMDAAWAVTKARIEHIPADGTVPIIMTQDSANWDAVNHPAYFVEAERGLRAGGYLMGGYGSRLMFDDCMGHGVTFDLMWATNAYSWGGGRHPNAHVWQGGHNTVGPGNPLYLGRPLIVAGMGNVDTNASHRPFPAWGPTVAVEPPTPSTPDDGDEPVNICTNAEQFFADRPNVVKFLVTSTGKLRHLSEPEWIARGSEPGVPLTNAQISVLGTV